MPLADTETRCHTIEVEQSRRSRRLRHGAQTAIDLSDNGAA